MTLDQIGRRSFGGFGRFRGASPGSSVREFGSSEYVCPISRSSKTMSHHRIALETKMQKAQEDDDLTSKDRPVNEVCHCVKVYDSLTALIYFAFALIPEAAKVNISC